MVVIATFLMLALTGFADESGAPLEGHRLCIEFLNQNFGETGRVYRAGVKFTPDARMIRPGNTSSELETAYLQSYSTPPPSDIAEPKKPVPPLTMGSTLDYRLYQSTDLKHLKAFHLAHVVPDRVQNIQVDNPRNGRTRKNDEFKQNSILNANVEFGWDKIRKVCTITKFTRTTFDITNKKPSTLVYPTLAECRSFIAAPVGDRQNQLIRNYLSATESQGFQSPFHSLKEFEKLPISDREKPTYTPLPVINQCKYIYREFIDASVGPSLSPAPSDGST